MFRYLFGLRFLGWRLGALAPLCALISLFALQQAFATGSGWALVWSIFMVILDITLIINLIINPPSFDLADLGR